MTTAACKCLADLDGFSAVLQIGKPALACSALLAEVVHSRLKLQTAIAMSPAGHACSSVR